MTKIAVKNSSGVTITINSIEEYEEHVKQRVAERTEQLETMLADAGERTAEQRSLISLLQSQIDRDAESLLDAEQAFAKFKRTIAELARLLSDAKDATASIGENRIADAKARVEAGDLDAADEIFVEVQEIEAGPIKRAADASYGRGLIAEEQVRWHDAATHYARAAQLDPSFDTLKKANDFALQVGDYKAALRHGEDLVKLVESGNFPIAYKAVAYNGHGSSLRALGLYGEAQKAITQALDCFISITKFSASPVLLSNYAACLANLAVVHVKLNELEDAKLIYKQVLELFEAAKQTGTDQHSTVLSSLGIIYQRMDNCPQAEKLHREALKIDAVTIGIEHPEHAKHLNNLAGALMNQNKFKEAESYVRQAIQIDEGSIGKMHPEYANHLNTLAGILQSQNQFEEAEALFRRAIEIDETDVSSVHPDYANRLNNLARILQFQGKSDEAAGFFRKAIKVAERGLGYEHAQTNLYRKNLEQLLAKSKP